MSSRRRSLRRRPGALIAVSCWLTFVVACSGGRTKDVSDEEEDPQTDGESEGDDEGDGPSLARAAEEVAGLDPDEQASCRSTRSVDGRLFATRPALRRLAMDQYANVLRDLAAEPAFALTVHPDPAPDGNESAPSALRVTRQVVADLDANAWALAPTLTKRLNAELGCDATADRACLARGLDVLATWLHRRPLAEAAKTRYLALADKLRAEASDVALEALVAAFAQAPELIYHLDEPRGARAGTGLRRLDDWQLAEQLSLFLWRSGPDATLRTLASGNKLSDRATLETELRRMLDDPRSSRATGYYVGQWLMLGGLDGKSKDEPGWQPELAQAFRADTERVFAALMTGGKAKFADLFAHRTAFVTAQNAAILGQDGSAVGQGRLVELQGRRRVGLLTHNSFLTAHSKVSGAAPILRGNAVMKQVLCRPIAGPPDDLDIPAEPEHVDGTTAREVLAQHRQKPICATCHKFIDPPGLALELWDGLGRFREADGDVAIDPSGELPIDGDEMQAFKTPEELFTRVGASASAQHCFASRWMGQSLGKSVVTASERCALENVDGRLRASGYGLRAALEQMVLQPGFSLRWEGARR